MISVIVPTSRVGGLDVLFGSLARQTYRDFELVLVDALYERRKDLVSQQAIQLGIAVTHLPPRGTRPDQEIETGVLCRTLNTGIAHARGELVFLTCDYSWLDEDCLATHATFHASHPDRALMLDYVYTTFPTPHSCFRGYSPDLKAAGTPEADQINDLVVNRRLMETAMVDYLEDLKGGRLDPVMWSLWTDFTADAQSIKNLPITLRHSKPPEPNPDWCSFKNESIPTEFLLRLNGMDEEFDGAHLYCDTDMSYRLVHRLMIPWTTVPGGLVRVVNPRSVFSCRKLVRPMEENLLRLERNKAATESKVNPHLDLRSQRETNLRAMRTAMVQAMREQSSQVKPSPTPPIVSARPASATGHIKLNLASGTDLRDGWVNLDIIPKWPLGRRGCDILWDARCDRIPFLDGSVEEIYGGYLLLHLARRHHDFVLHEIARVLQPGGMVVFCEIDMDVVMHRYLANPEDPEAGDLIWGEQGTVHGDEFADFDKHCYGYTEASLRKKLETLGLVQIDRIKVHPPSAFYELSLRAVKP